MAILEGGPGPVLVVVPTGNSLLQGQLRDQPVRLARLDCSKPEQRQQSHRTILQCCSVCFHDAQSSNMNFAFLPNRLRRHVMTDEATCGETIDFFNNMSMCGHAKVLRTSFWSVRLPRHEAVAICAAAVRPDNRYA